MRFVFLLALFCSGCAGQISTANIRDTATPVLERHDAYVDADTKLLSTDKTVLKLKSSLVRQQLERKEIPVEEFEPPMSAVMDVHDTYVNKLETNTTLKRVYLRSTAILRDVIKEAKND